MQESKELMTQLEQKQDLNPPPLVSSVEAPSVVASSLAVPTDSAVSPWQRVAELEALLKASKQLQEESERRHAQLLEALAHGNISLDADQILELFYKEKGSGTIQSPVLLFLIDLKKGARNFAIKKYPVTNPYSKINGDIEFLHYAAWKGHLPFFKWLDAQDLLNKDKPNNLLKHRESRFSNRGVPLSFAAQAGKLEIIRLLIERGASVKSLDMNKKRYSVLDWAIAVEGEKDIASAAYLIQCGAMLNYHKPEWRTYCEAVDSAARNVIQTIKDKKTFAPHELGWTKTGLLTDPVKKFITNEYLNLTKITEESSSQPGLVSSLPVESKEESHITSTTPQEILLARINYLVKEFGSEITRYISADRILELFDAEDDLENIKNPILTVLITQLGGEKNFALQKYTVTDANDKQDINLELLHIAAWRGKFNFFRWLDVRGLLKNHLLDYRESCYKNQGVPLAFAAQAEQEVIIRFLLERGANIHMCDMNPTGYSVLDWACVVEASPAIIAYLMQCGATFHHFGSDSHSDIVNSTAKNIIQTITTRQPFQQHEMGWAQQNSSLRQQVITFLQTQFLNMDAIQRSDESKESKAEEPDLIQELQNRIAYMKTNLADLNFVTVDWATKYMLDACNEKISVKPQQVIALLLREGFWLNDYYKEEKLTAEGKLRYQQGMLQALVEIGKKLIANVALSESEKRFIQHPNTQQLFVICADIPTFVARFGPQGDLRDFFTTTSSEGTAQSPLVQAAQFFNDVCQRLSQQNLCAAELQIPMDRVLETVKQSQCNEAAAAFLPAQDSVLPDGISAAELLNGMVKIDTTCELRNGQKLVMKGEKPLWFHLCVNNQLEKLKYLFNDEKVADTALIKEFVNRCDGKLKLTPLIIAVIFGHRELAVWLLKNGAAVQHETADNILYWACKNRDLEMVEMFLLQGADPNVDKLQLSEGEAGFLKFTLNKNKLLMKIAATFLLNIVNNTLTEPQRQVVLSVPQYRAAILQYLTTGFLHPNLTVKEMERRLEVVESAMQEAADAIVVEKSVLATILSGAKLDHFIQLQRQAVEKAKEKQKIARSLQELFYEVSNAQDKKQGEEQDKKQEEQELTSVQKSMRTLLTTEFLTLPPEENLNDFLTLESRVIRLEAAIKEAGEEGHYHNKSPLTQLIIGEPKEYNAKEWTAAITFFSSIFTKKESYAQELRKLVSQRRKEVDKMLQKVSAKEGHELAETGSDNVRANVLGTGFSKG